MQSHIRPKGLGEGAVEGKAPLAKAPAVRTFRLGQTSTAFSGSSLKAAPEIAPLKEIPYAKQQSAKAIASSMSVILKSSESGEGPQAADQMKERVRNWIAKVKANKEGAESLAPPPSSPSVASGKSRAVKAEPSTVSFPPSKTLQPKLVRTTPPKVLALAKGTTSVKATPISKVGNKATSPDSALIAKSTSKVILIPKSVSLKAAVPRKLDVLPKPIPLIKSLPPAKVIPPTPMPASKSVALRVATPPEPFSSRRPTVQFKSPPLASGGPLTRPSTAPPMAVTPPSRQTPPSITVTDASTASIEQLKRIPTFSGPLSLSEILKRKKAENPRPDVRNEVKVDLKRPAPDVDSHQLDLKPPAKKAPELLRILQDDILPEQAPIDSLWLSHPELSQILRNTNGIVVSASVREWLSSVIDDAIRSISAHPFKVAPVHSSQPVMTLEMLKSRCEATASLLDVVQSALTEVVKQTESNFEAIMQSELQQTWKHAATSIAKLSHGRNLLKDLSAKFGMQQPSES